MVCLCLMLLVFIFYNVNTLKVEGNIATTADWQFMTRFCFKSKNGKLDFIIEYPKRYGTQSLLFYYDRDEMWEKVYKSSTMTCDEKKSILSKDAYQIFDLDETNIHAKCRTANKGGEPYNFCNNTQGFASSRDMWWFLVISRCESSAKNKDIKGVNVTYGFHMTNGEEGDILHREFSADEFYILPIDIAFLLVYVIILIVSVIFTYILHKKTLFHTTYKMFVASLWIWWFHLFLYCISYGKYSQTGYRQDGTNRAARVFASISTIIFMLMLMLMADGYTIVRGRVGNITTVFITIVVTLYTIITGIMLIMEANTFDEALVLYIYDFWPGYCLIVLRIACWIIFTVLLYATVFKHRKKVMFYAPLFTWYTLWFWAGPIVIFIAMFVMDEWAREKTVHGVEQFVMLCGHAFFLVLTRPQAANSNFPYHVKTTQIGFLLDDEDRGNNYEVSSPEESNEKAPNFYDMFMTSTTNNNNSRSKRTRNTEPDNNSDDSSSSVRYDTFNMKDKRQKSASTSLPPIKGALPRSRDQTEEETSAKPSTSSELENATKRDFSIFNVDRGEV